MAKRSKKNTEIKYIKYLTWQRDKRFYISNKPILEDVNAKSCFVQNLSIEPKDGDLINSVVPTNCFVAFQNCAVVCLSVPNFLVLGADECSTEL